MNSSSVKDNILATSKCIFRGDRKKKQQEQQQQQKVSDISNWALYI